MEGLHRKRGDVFVEVKHKTLYVVHTIVHDTTSIHVMCFRLNGCFTSAYLETRKKLMLINKDSTWDCVMETQTSSDDIRQAILDSHSEHNKTI